LIDGYTVMLPVRFGRMCCSPKMLITLDDLVDVGLGRVGGGGHSNSESHYCEFISLINSLRSR